MEEQIDATMRNYPTIKELTTFGERTEIIENASYLAKRTGQSIHAYYFQPLEKFAREYGISGIKKMLSDWKKEVAELEAAVAQPTERK